MTHETLTDVFEAPRPIEQGSPEWFLLRCGKVTASRIADLMAKPRVPGQGMRANYLAEIVAERLTGCPTKTYQNKVMEEGHEWEPKARAAYIFVTGNPVSKIPFIDHPDIPMAGVSPDGFVTTAGLLEIKCPYASTHQDMLINEVIPTDYVKQMQWQMACTSRDWCDFVSYNDDMPERMRLFIKRVARDNGMIAEMETAVRAIPARGRLAPLSAQGEISRMITDDEIDKVLDYLRDNASKAAKARGERWHMEEYRKVVKSEEMKKHDELPLGAQEREAYASDRYKKHLEAVRDAIVIDENYRFLRDAAQSKVDAWQTQSANIRGGLK